MSSQDNELLQFFKNLARENASASGSHSDETMYHNQDEVDPSTIENTSHANYNESNYDEFGKSRTSTDNYNSVEGRFVDLRDDKNEYNRSPKPIGILYYPNVGSKKEFREELKALRQCDLNGKRWSSTRRLVKNILHRCKSGDSSSRRVYRDFIKESLKGTLIQYLKSFPLDRKYSSYLGGGTFEIRQNMPDFMLFEVLKSIRYVKTSLRYERLKRLSGIGISLVRLIRQKTLSCLRNPKV
jgi:hypothetical protein